MTRKTFSWPPENEKCQWCNCVSQSTEGWTLEGTDWYCPECWPKAEFDAVCTRMEAADLAEMNE